MMILHLEIDLLLIYAIVFTYLIQCDAGMPPGILRPFHQSSYKISLERNEVCKLNDLLRMRGGCSNQEIGTNNHGKLGGPDKKMNSDVGVGTANQNNAETSPSKIKHNFLQKMFRLCVPTLKLFSLLVFILYSLRSGVKANLPRIFPSLEKGKILPALKKFFLFFAGFDAGFDLPIFLHMLEFAKVSLFLTFVCRWIFKKQGTIKYRNGKFTGKMRFGRPHGKGTLAFSSGTKYFGEFLRGKAHGKGCFVFANGNIFEGEIQEGLPHGQGNFIQSDRTTYSGGFQNGKMHGVGKIEFSNGAEYIGGMRNGTQCGWGAMLFVNQDTYEGQFNMGQPNGFGTLLTNGGSYYQGQFENGNFHGFGILQPNISSFQTGSTKIPQAHQARYEGQFAKGQPHGQGILYLPTGSRMEGTFKEGKPFGTVAVQSPDGDVMDVVFDDEGKPCD